MINTLNYNSKKLNEYPCYHIRISIGDNIILESFDLSIDKVNSITNAIKDGQDYIVIGTLEKVDMCLEYVNKCKNNGLLFCDLCRSDIFESKQSIFVDCTSYFKNI